MNRQLSVTYWVLHLENSDIQLMKPPGRRSTGLGLPSGISMRNGQFLTHFEVGLIAEEIFLVVLGRG